MNIELKNEILEKANLPQSWWDDCFITEDEMIFTPNFDEEGVMVATGEEVHKQWLEAKENPVEPEPSPEEKITILKEQVDSLKEEVMTTAQYVTDLKLELFKLRTLLQAE